jgi:hypothetical protein
MNGELAISVLYTSALVYEYPAGFVLIISISKHAFQLAEEKEERHSYDTLHQVTPYVKWPLE